MTQLIGITGKARHGKDTVARLLVERGFKRQAFADRLKLTLATLTGEDVSLYHDDVAKEQICPALGVTRRQAMQDFGDGMRQLFGDNVWVDAVLSTWESEGFPNTVISDVRYTSEAYEVLGADGVVLEVHRPGAPALTADAAKHISEQGVKSDTVAYVIVNDGSLEDLGRKVDKFLAWLSGVEWNVDSEGGHVG